MADTNFPELGGAEKKTSSDGDSIPESPSRAHDDEPAAAEDSDSSWEFVEEKEAGLEPVNVTDDKGVVKVSMNLLKTTPL